MKCESCRKQDALETLPEKIARWVVKHIFPNTLKDEISGAQLKGFDIGYELSGKHGQELKQLEYQYARLEELITNLLKTRV